MVTMTDVFYAIGDFSYVIFGGMKKMGHGPNIILWSIIVFLLGFQLLFYGLLMINVTVFIAGYFISFAIYGGIFTVFLGPDSSSIAVYFSLLFILLASTLSAYGLTKLINISIFFIGACIYLNLI